jgi:hypothetical protein
MSSGEYQMAGENCRIAGRSMFHMKHNLRNPARERPAGIDTGC